MFIWSTSDKIVLPIAIATVFVIAIILRILLKNKSENIKKLPLRVLAVLGVVLEISKQVYYIFIADNYITYALPFHFCTLILIMLPLAQFLPKKLARFVKPPALIFSLLVFALILVHPRSMIGNSTAGLLKSFPNFHTFAFHFVVIAYAVFSIFLGDYAPRYKDFVSLLVCILVYASYGIPAAYTLNSNYINILKSLIPPLESIRLAVGQVFYNVILFAGISVISVAVLFIYTFIYNITKKLRRINYGT